MAYVVEEVSIEDREKILADVSYAPPRRSRFAKWGVFRDPTGRYKDMRWAIDRESGSYLFGSESYARELENGYHFFFDGRMYEIGVAELREADGRRQVEVHAIDQAGDLKHLPLAFKDHLTAAFREYGLYGFGKYTRDGRNFALDVTPVFSEEA